MTPLLVMEVGASQFQSTGTNRNAQRIARGPMGTAIENVMRNAKIVIAIRLGSAPSDERDRVRVACRLFPPGGSGGMACGLRAARHPHSDAPSGGRERASHRS